MSSLSENTRFYFVCISYIYETNTIFIVCIIVLSWFKSRTLYNLSTNWDKLFGSLQNLQLIKVPPTLQSFWNILWSYEKILLSYEKLSNIVVVIMKIKI